jgi:hypothetical protein
MSKKPSTRPHPPSTPAQKSWAGGHTTGLRAPYVVRARARVCANARKQVCECQKTLGEWIPKTMQLPDSLEAIEAGRPPRQRRLFDDAQPDDSRAERLARILATCPVTTADRLGRAPA